MYPRNLNTLQLEEAINVARTERDEASVLLKRNEGEDIIMITTMMITIVIIMTNNHKNNNASIIMIIRTLYSIMI